MMSAMIPVRPQAPHLLDILRADFAKNGGAMTCSVDEYIAGFERYVAKGGLIFLADKMFVAYAPLSNSIDGIGGADVVEFHCVNGGTGSDLANGVNSFLAWAKTLFCCAVTYYDNPKNTELFERYSNHPFTVRQVDGGLYRTFEATVRLKESPWAS